jgi:hypothetical protein
VVIYNFYNANLLDIARAKENELKLGYIDDVKPTKTTKTFADANRGMRDVMERARGALERSREHSSTFDVEKMKLICFTRRRKSYTFRIGKLLPYLDQI